jgi:hypothetical protein
LVDAVDALTFSVTAPANSTEFYEPLVASKLRAQSTTVVLAGITETGATPLAGFQIMLRSASSEIAAQIGREQIEKFHHKKIAAALHGEMAAQRAAVVLSLIAGFQMMRQMIGLRSLSRAAPDTLVKILAPLFQMLIDGDRPTRPPLSG